MYMFSIYIRTYNYNQACAQLIMISRDRYRDIYIDGTGCAHICTYVYMYMHMCVRVLQLALAVLQDSYVNIRTYTCTRVRIQNSDI